MIRPMGEPADALSARSYEEIKGRPCRHAWLVCLSDCHRGDHKQGSLSRKDSISLENIYHGDGSTTFSKYSKKGQLCTLNLCTKQQNRATKSPFYRGAKLWPKLPPNIRKMEGKEEFKLATKKHFGL